MKSFQIITLKTFNRFNVCDSVPLVAAAGNVCFVLNTTADLVFKATHKQTSVWGEEDSKAEVGWTSGVHRGGVGVKAWRHHDVVDPAG